MAWIGPVRRALFIGESSHWNAMVRDVTAWVESNLKFKKFVFQERLLAEGGLIPAWYGYSYHDPMRMVFVCHIIPFHFFVKAWRWVYFKFKFPNDPWSEAMRPR